MAGRGAACGGRWQLDVVGLISALNMNFHRSARDSYDIIMVSHFKRSGFLYFRVSLLVLSATLLLTSASTVATEKYTPAERRHWAFQPRSNVAPPVIAGAKTTVDAFLLARLAKEGMTFAPVASKETLIRRLYFDLTGLPPTPADIDTFLKDRSTNAYERLVDRLLASPRYGERWGQHWLDVVRFAESDGFEYDTHRPDAWRYRDYVIRSMQQDKPYNVFLSEQIAGDETAPENDEARVAAGLQRLGPLRRNAATKESPPAGTSAHRDDQRRSVGHAGRHASLRSLP